MKKRHPYDSTKNIQIFKLLLSNKEFIKNIDDFREKEKINLYDNPIHWMELNYSEFYTWFGSDEYKKEADEIERKYKEKEINIIEKRKLSKKLHNKNPINKVHLFCIEMIKKFNLPYNFESDINEFLFTKNFDNPLLGAGVFFQETNQYRDKEEKILSIDIFQSPSEEDFEVLKNFIKRKTKDFPKYKIIKRLDEKLEMENAYDNKKLYTEAGEEINNKTLAEEYIGDPSKNKKVVDEVKAIKKVKNKLFNKVPKK